MSDNLGKQNNAPVLLLLLSAIVLGLIIGLKDFISDYKEKKLAEQSEPKQSQPVLPEQKFYEPEVSAGIRTIRINPLQEFNGLSKSEIYSIREKYVNESIFANSGYYPSEEVFGQIENGKLWWGMNRYICHKDDTTSGVSAMSRYINNPAILISPMNAYGFSNIEEFGNKYNHYCNSDYMKFIPVEMTYNSDNKTITARYKVHREIIDRAEDFGSKGQPHYLTMIGMNARDLGYGYIKVVSFHNIKMQSDYNASTHVYTLADFIHTGGSCRAEGGCNNISPYQPELDFRFTDLPASMEIYLWSKFPQKDTFPPDIIYRMQFEETFE